MISLNYRDSRPIYEQIRDGLRKLIVTGALSADEKLPSVRGGCRPAGHQSQYHPASLITSWRARDTSTRSPGKGSFAAANAAADSARRAELLTQVRELLSELRYLGVSQQELLNLVKEASPS